MPQSRMSPVGLGSGKWVRMREEKEKLTVWKQCLAMILTVAYWELSGVLCSPLRTRDLKTKKREKAIAAGVRGFPFSIWAWSCLALMHMTTVKWNEIINNFPEGCRRYELRKWMHLACHTVDGLPFAQGFLSPTSFSISGPSGPTPSPMVGETGCPGPESRRATFKVPWDFSSWGVNECWSPRAPGPSAAWESGHRGRVTLLLVLWLSSLLLSVLIQPARDGSQTHTDFPEGFLFTFFD